MPDFGGCRFYEYCWNSKILVAPPASPAFQPCFLGPWAKNQKSAPNILFALLSRFRKDMTQPPCPKTPRVDRFGRNPLFQGPGLTPRASGSKLPVQKLLARSKVDPETLTTIWPLGQKLFHIVAVTADRQTHILNPPGPLRKFFFLYYFMHGGMGNFKPCEISTISLHEACFAHFTREG